MKHNRFKHHVETFCKKFSGWELIHDIDRLRNIEDGKIDINILSGDCYYNSKQIEPLNISEAIQNWFFKDLKKFNLSKDKIFEASISINFSFNLEGKKDSKLHVNCKSRIVSGNIEYTCSYNNLNQTSTVLVNTVEEQ